MHVGIFNDSYLPIVDGVTTIVESYAKRLVGKCDVTIFTPHTWDLDPAYDDKFPYRVERCFSVMKKNDDYPQGFPMLDPSFRRKIVDAKLDIIHIHSAYTMGLCAKHYARKLGIPMVGTIHSHFRPDVRQYVGKLLTEPTVRWMMTNYNSCEECWTVNRVVGEMFRRDYGLTAPYRVMPFSTDHHPVGDEAEARAEVNAAYGIGDDEFLMTHVGRQDLQKNEDFILRSLGELKREGRPFKMLFVGHGNKHDYLRHLAVQLGIGDEVIFTGNLTDMDRMMKIYSRTDLLLFPSQADTFGLVKIEAACQHTPALLLRGSMASDGVQEDVDAFLSDEGEKNYAAKIMRLQDDRDLLRRVGEGAFRNIYHTWDSLVDDVYERYLGIIRSYRTAHGG